MAAQDLSQIKPEKSQEDWGTALLVEKLTRDTVYQALQIFTKAASGKIGEVLLKEKSAIPAKLFHMAEHPDKYENMGVKIARTSEYVEGKKEKIEVFSIRLEADKILTLRVGEDFTEISLATGTKLDEIISQQGDNIKYEKYT